MPDRLVTPPGDGPVSLALAKAHLVIDHTVDDELIAQCIAAATTYGEQFCNRGFVTQRWEAVFPGFPVSSPSSCDAFLELRRGNLLASPAPVVTYRDQAGALQTLDATAYLLDDVSTPGRLRLAPDQSWPTIQARWDAVRVAYSVGWASASVPKPIVQALLLLVSQLYENRTPEITGTIVASLKFAVESLLAPYRIHAL